MTNEVVEIPLQLCLWCHHRHFKHADCCWLLSIVLWFQLGFQRFLQHTPKVREITWTKFRLIASKSYLQHVIRLSFCGRQSGQDWIYYRLASFDECGRGRWYKHTWTLDWITGINHWTGIFLFCGLILIVVIVIVIWLALGTFSTKKLKLECVCWPMPMFTKC